MLELVLRSLRYANDDEGHPGVDYFMYVAPRSITNASTTVKRKMG